MCACVLECEHIHTHTHVNQFFRLSMSALCCDCVFALNCLCRSTMPTWPSPPCAQHVIMPPSSLQLHQCGGAGVGLGDACQPMMVSGSIHSPDSVRGVLMYAMLNLGWTLPSSFATIEQRCDTDGVIGHSSAELLCALEALAPQNTERIVLEMLLQNCL